MLILSMEKRVLEKSCWFFCFCPGAAVKGKRRIPVGNVDPADRLIRNHPDIILDHA